MNLLQDYLSNHKPITKVDLLYSFWKDILSGLPQDPIPVSPLFNIFMCDKFLILKTIYFAGYADDNTPFVVAVNIKDIMRSLEEVGENLITSFSNNK